jgi:hypothetical protein
MRITESRLRRIIREEITRDLISERADSHVIRREGGVKVYKGVTADDPYEYKYLLGTWFYKKPNETRWRQAAKKSWQTLDFQYRLSDPKVADDYGRSKAVEAERAARDQNPIFKHSAAAFPFSPDDQVEGNRFRSWMHDSHPDAVIKTDLNLSISGPPSNSYMKKAWARYGSEYMKSQKTSERKRIEREERKSSTEAGDRKSKEYEKLSWLEKRKQDFGDYWRGDTGDTGDTGEDDNTADDDADEITYHQNLPWANDYAKMKDEDFLKQGKEVRGVWKCTDTNCAQYVSDTLETGMGNAWHAHTYTNPTLESAFNDGASRNKDIYAKIFTDLNRSRGKGRDADVQKVVTRLIPPKSRWGDLQLGDVVGLYYHPSDYHSKAFFEAGSGYSLSNKSRVGGPFFLRKDTGAKWSPSDLGKDVQFIPGATLSGGKGFGMNTHLGFVGAKYNGKPIIFHNIHGRVDATPLSAMGKTMAIVWSKTPSQPISEVFYKKDIVNRQLIEDMSSSKESTVDNVLKEIKPSIDKLSKILGITRKEFELLLAVAILVADRESDLGQGKRYKYHPSHGNIVQTAVAEFNKVLTDVSGYSVMDPSVGPAQIKYGTIEHDLPADYREEIGVSRPHDLSNMTKAVLAAVGLLSAYYKKAIKIKISYGRPGVNSGYTWKSSGHAAVDMAIAAYNGGASKISNYCGAKKIKSKCKSGDSGWVENYIPASQRFGMGYVDEITNLLPNMLSKVRSIMSSNQS